MKKSLFTKWSLFDKTTFIPYHERLEATITFYLHHNSNLKNLSSLRNHIPDKKSKEEFIILRDNYCFRTIHTAANLALMLNQALKEHDFLTASLLGQNLFEETGEGNSEKSHVIYMLNLFNTLSSEFFNVDTLEIGSLRKSQYITQSTLLYANKMTSMYQSDTEYRTKLGVVLAHENTAPTMLYALKEILAPFITTLNEEHQIMCFNYFNCHLDGIEHKHGSDMLKCAANVCKNETNFMDVIKGVGFFHTYQGEMWKGLELQISSNCNIHGETRFFNKE